MRNFLTNLNIVGAVLVSRTGDIVHYCIKDLLRNCNSIIIVLDNPDEKTRKIVERYDKVYREIKLIHSPYPVTTKEEEEKDPLCIRRRFKGMQGEVRQLVFDELKIRHNSGEKIDILIWPDHDECFTVNLPNVLEGFWNSPYKALTMKAIDVFGDFETIHDYGQSGHTRIFKYFPELTAIPYRWRTNYLPLKRSERTGSDFSLVHLSLLTKDAIDWRSKYWSETPLNTAMALWRVGKDVRKCMPEEIKTIKKREPDLNVYEYLRGGDKYVPCGKENLDKALKECGEMLELMGIRYYLLFGTALGIYKNGCVFPWDWDLDIGILFEDLNKLDKELIIKKGFTDLKIKTDIPKWKKEDGTMSNEFVTRTVSFKRYSVRCDLDIIYESKCGQYKYIPKGRKREFMVASAPVSWFDEPKKIIYNEKEYNIPSSIEKYFESNYGPDWRIPKWGHQNWNHRACRRDYYEIK